MKVYVIVVSMFLQFIILGNTLLAQSADIEDIKVGLEVGQLVPVPYFEQINDQYNEADISVLKTNTNLIQDEDLRQEIIEKKFNLYQKHPLKYRNAQLFYWDSKIYIRNYMEQYFRPANIKSRNEINNQQSPEDIYRKYYYFIPDSLSSEKLQKLNYDSFEADIRNEWHNIDLNKSSLDTLLKYGVLVLPHNNPPSELNIINMQDRSTRNNREVIFTWDAFLSDIGDVDSGEPWISYDLDSDDGYVYWDDNFFEGHYRAYCADGGSDPAWTVYENNMQAWLDMDPSLFIDITDLGNIDYTFDVRYETEATYDYGIAYVATNNYSSFVELDTFSGNAGSSWQTVSYSFDNNASSWDDLELTFLFFSDFSNTDLGFFVDNIVVEGFGGSPPNAPTGLTATDNECNQITIDWNTVTGATNYKVYRDGSFLADDSNPPYTNNTTGTHSYYVKAENNYGVSGNSNSDNGTSGSAPSAPTGLSATDDECNQITIDWNTVTGATNYQVYRDGSFLADDSNPPFTDINIAGAYNYSIKAENNCGLSNDANASGVALINIDITQINYEINNNGGYIFSADAIWYDGAEISYLWDFGDGSDLSNEPTPVHDYQSNGTFELQLTISYTDENQGNCSDTFLTQIIVNLTVGNEIGIPSSYNLSHAYPNPFNPTTTITYALPEESLVRLDVYDALGKKVRTLLHQVQGSGYKSYQWDGKNELGSAVSGGLYFVRLNAGNYDHSIKVVYLK